MKRARSAAALVAAIFGSMSIAGCRDNTPAPPRVPVPESDPRAGMHERAPMKPLPPPRDEGAGAPQPMYADPPLVSQRLPEQRAFVDAYTRVGRPRIAVLVRSTGRSPASADFNATPIDYSLVENVMVDWMRCNGQVTVVDAGVAPQTQTPLSNDPAPRLRAENADVGILIDAESTKQAMTSSSLRMVGSAVDVRTGRIIATADADVAPPLDKSQVDESTRLLARQLMDEMTETWSAPMPASAPPAPLPPSTAPGN